MKKVLISLGALVATVAPITAVVACGGNDSADSKNTKDETKGSDSTKSSDTPDTSKFGTSVTTQDTTPSSDSSSASNNGSGPAAPKTTQSVPAGSQGNNGSAPAATHTTQSSSAGSQGKNVSGPAAPKTTQSVPAGSQGNNGSAPAATHTTQSGSASSQGMKADEVSIVDIAAFTNAIKDKGFELTLDSNSEINKLFAKATSVVFKPGAITDSTKDVDGIYGTDDYAVLVKGTPEDNKSVEIDNTTGKDGDYLDVSAKFDDQNTKSTDAKDTSVLERWNLTLADLKNYSHIIFVQKYTDTSVDPELGLYQIAEYKDGAFAIKSIDVTNDEVALATP